MIECLPPIAGELVDVPESFRPVTSMEAKLSENRRIVILSLNDPGRADYPLVYALSPPAAAQLSRLLEEAVQEYLDPDND